MKLRSAALTDIGKVRLQNQDCPLHHPALGLFGVADGVGGLPGGAEAAECAVRSLMQTARAAGGGRLVLSGLLANQEAEVLAAYRARRWRLKRRIAIAGWHTLVLGGRRRP